MSILVVKNVVRDGLGFILNRCIPNHVEVLEIMQNSTTAPLELEIDDILVDRREDEDMDSTPNPNRVKVVKGELCEAIPIERDFTKKGATLPEGFEDLNEEAQNAMLAKFFTKNLDNRFLAKMNAGIKLIKDSFGEKRSGTLVTAPFTKARLLEENEITDVELKAMAKMIKGEEMHMSEFKALTFSPKFRRRIRREHPAITEEVPRYRESAVELMKLIDEDGPHMERGNKEGTALELAARNHRHKEYTHVELYHAVKEREDHSEGRHMIADNVADFSLMNAMLEAAGYEKQIMADDGKFDWPSEIAARNRALNKHAAKKQLYMRTEGGKEADMETQDQRIAQWTLQLEETEDRTERRYISDLIALEKYGEINTDFARSKDRKIDFVPSPDGNFVTNQIKVSYICLKASALRRDDMKQRKALMANWEMTFGQDDRIHLFPRKDIYVGGIRWDVDEEWLKTYAKYSNAIELTVDEEAQLDEAEGKAKHALNNDYSGNAEFDENGCRTAKVVSSGV